MIQLKVNGEDINIEEGVSISALLIDQNISAQGIAVELNREIVPKGNHNETTLKEGDIMEIVKMVGGG
jgi:sulfur carrier protein